MAMWLKRAAYVMVAAVAAPIATHFVRPTFDVHTSGIIVVSGASSGIGASAALKLASLGFTVLAGVRDLRDGEALEDAFLGGKAGGAVVPFRLDVTDAASVAGAAEAAASLAIARGLNVVGVLCNAGVISPALPVEMGDPAADARLFSVNYYGAKALAVAMLPQLRASRGRLVLVSSLAGHIAAPFGQPYSASKFAVRSLGDALRAELRPSGVSVSRVDPGFVDTPILGASKGGQAGGWFGTEVFGALPAATRAPYAEHFAAVSSKLAQSAARAFSTASTDSAIAHAFTSARPQAAYHPGSVEGLPARFAVGAFALLGAVDPAWQDLVANAAAAM